MKENRCLCPVCKAKVAPSEDDRQGWYWLCPKCRKAVTSESNRYCPGCKGDVQAWTYGPSINLMDPRPWYLRDPWFCGKCGGQTYSGKAEAAVSKVFYTIFAIVFCAAALIFGVSFLFGVIIEALGKK